MGRSATLAVGAAGDTAVDVDGAGVSGGADAALSATDPDAGATSVAGPPAQRRATRPTRTTAASAPPPTATSKPHGVAARAPPWVVALSEVMSSVGCCTVGLKRPTGAPARSAAIGPTMLTEVLSACARSGAPDGGAGRSELRRSWFSTAATSAARAASACSATRCTHSPTSRPVCGCTAASSAMAISRAVWNLASGSCESPRSTMTSSSVGKVGVTPLGGSCAASTMWVAAAATFSVFTKRRPVSISQSTTDTA